MKTRLLMLVLWVVACAAYAGYDEGVAAIKANNYELAWQELLPLAQAGDARAQNEVSAMYANGVGVPQDMNAALMWVKQAAQQGNAQAQNNLALVYDKGLMIDFGIKKDFKKAAALYQQAAQQGMTDAQWNLAALYATGQPGVPKNVELAYAWYEIAISHGASGAVTYRDQLKPALSTAQLKRALRRAQKWQLGHPLPK